MAGAEIETSGHRLEWSEISMARPSLARYPGGGRGKKRGCPDFQIAKISPPEGEITKSKGVGQWWWMHDDGSYLVAIKYGKRPLELAKGKFAISCPTTDDVRASIVKWELICRNRETNKSKFEEFTIESKL